MAIKILFLLFIHSLIFTNALQLFPNGVNLQPSYYNDGSPASFAWDLMKAQPYIGTVRIEIDLDRVNATIAKTWIDQANAQGYHVIATYHTIETMGNSTKDELLKAAQWWVDNYAYLGWNFTINLANEWADHDITANDYAEAYNEAIAVVRQVIFCRHVVNFNVC